MSDSSWPHGLQHTRSPCPSQSPRICPSLCPLHWWCHLAISSSDAISFCPQSVPASGTFPMSIWGWFPLRLTGLTSLQSKGLSGVFCNTTVWRHQLALCLLYDPTLTTVCDHWEDHSLDYMDVCRQSDVSAFQHPLYEVSKIVKLVESETRIRCQGLGEGGNRELVNE